MYRSSLLFVVFGNFRKLKVPRAARAVTVRSLGTLDRCHSEYLADLKKAKQHQNVIGESFFDIPLSQVNHFVTGQFFLIYTSNYIGLSTWSSYNLRNLSKIDSVFNLLEEECHL